MIYKTSTIGMSRKMWLDERRKSLGGSDIGAILGMNPYSSPYAIWANKTGRIPDSEDNEAMRQGRDLEEYVARRFSDLTGLRVRRVNAIIRNNKYPHLHANIDREVIGGTCGLECKTASALSESRFANGDFPSSYYAQCVSYLAVTEKQRWYLAVLILGKGFKVFQMTTIENDRVPEWCDSSVYVSREEISVLASAADHFWTEYVEKDAPPPADGLPATTEALQTIYREDRGGEVQLMGREDLFREYFSLKESADRISSAMEEIKQTIMGDLGDASRGSCQGFSVNWTSQERKSFDAKKFSKEHPEIDLDPYYKTTTVRPFKVKKEKVS